MDASNDFRRFFRRNCDRRSSHRTCGILIRIGLTDADRIHTAYTHLVHIFNLYSHACSRRCASPKMMLDFVHRCALVCRCASTLHACMLVQIHASTIGARIVIEFEASSFEHDELRIRAAENVAKGRAHRIPPLTSAGEHVPKCCS